MLITHFINNRRAMLAGRVAVPGGGYQRQGRTNAEVFGMEGDLPPLLRGPLVSRYKSPTGFTRKEFQYMEPGALFQWEELDPKWPHLVVASTDWFRLDPGGTVLYVDLTRVPTASGGNLLRARKGTSKQQSAAQMIRVAAQPRAATVPPALRSPVAVGNYYESFDT